VLVTLIKHAVEHGHAHYKAEESKHGYHKVDNNKVNEKEIELKMYSPPALFQSDLYIDITP